MAINRTQADRLLRLIDNVYEAALDERHWSSLAPQIGETFDSTSTTLQIQRSGDCSDILSMTDNVNARINEYHAHYWQCDIWVQRAVERIGLSRVGSSRDLVSDAEFQETEFYRDWCRHLDVFYVVGAVFPSGQNELGVLGIHRPRSAGAYEADDQDAVSRFMPHLQRALRIRHQLTQAAVQRRVSDATLDRCDTAALLVTAAGVIVYTNRRAEALLADGTAVCQCNGRLIGTRRSDDARLAALIRAAACMTDAQSRDGIMAMRRMDQSPLTILVAPFRLSWAGYPAAGAIVFIRDPGRSISAIATLQALFHFTPAEARIAQALANGLSIGEIGAAHGVSLHTVRKQLKIILAKTGTHRQAQCVAVILRSAATISRD